jgi:hypothetical protein
LVKLCLSFVYRWFGDAGLGMAPLGLVLPGSVFYTQICDELAYLSTKFKVKTLSCILGNMVNSVQLLSIWLQETLYQLTFTTTWSCLWDEIHCLLPVQRVTTWSYYCPFTQREIRTHSPWKQCLPTSRYISHHNLKKSETHTAVHLLWIIEFQHTRIWTTTLKVMYAYPDCMSEFVMMVQVALVCR